VAGDISLMISDVEHLSLLVTCISSLEEFLFKSSAFSTDICIAILYSATLLNFFD
jgi:hypothetical protein